MLKLMSFNPHPLLFTGDHGAYSDMLIEGQTGDQIPTNRFIFGISPQMLHVLGEIPASKQPLLILPDFSDRTVSDLLMFLRCGEINAKSEEDHLALQELLLHLNIDQQNKCNEMEDIGVGEEYSESGTGLERDLIKREKSENDDESEMKGAEDSNNDYIPPPVIRYSCQQCDSCFSSSQFLAKHITQMHKQGDLRCDQCTYCTSNKSNFKRHVDTTHKGLQKFQCDLCIKKFTQATVMEKHKNAVHFKLKSFVCEACGKAFAWKEHLVTHVKKIHCGEKPFCCGHCAVSFASRKDLQHHEKLNHDVKG